MDLNVSKIPCPFDGFVNKDLIGVDLTIAQKTWLGLQLCCRLTSLVDLVNEYHLKPETIRSYAVSFEEGTDYDNSSRETDDFDINDDEFLLEMIKNSGRTKESITDDELKMLIETTIQTRELRNSSSYIIQKIFQNS